MSFTTELPEHPNSHQPGSTGAEILKELNINLEQTFRLIDRILPLDSCLYHQVLPLELKDRCLILGMVNVEDTSALDYVRSLLTALNYTFKLQPIESRTYQSVISAYLYYTRSANQKSQDSFSREAEPSKSQASQKHPQAKVMESPNERATLIVDTPEEEQAPGLKNQLSNPATADRSEKSKRFSEQVRSSCAQSVQHLSNPSRSGNSLPSLEVQAIHLSATPEFLATLTAKQLWQELLARVISAGIGRIYFERHHDYGRVFWSKNGVWQSSIEKLGLSLFQDLLEELKQLANLTSTPVERVRKFEIERYYKQERILLRLRIDPGKHGEEGTLQILRGKALEFYQQKQMDELGEQALQLAQQLERKLRQMRARACINPTRPKDLTALQEIQAKIKQQLDSIS